MIFTTVQGRLQYDALDPATWNELLELGGREHTLDPTDVRGEDAPFSDFHDAFVDLTGEPDDPGQFTDDDVPHDLHLPHRRPSASSSPSVPEGDRDGNEREQRSVNEGAGRDNEPKHPTGTKVRKHFGKHGWYQGEITSIDYEHRAMQRWRFRRHVV